MTECDRIINQGILPESFFREEVRDGFFVSKKRKKIWGIQLDMLLEFDRICKKFGLRYFLNSGSLLGAIRHKGFIPWDDDLDVVMWREDYEKFVLLSEEFAAPYFLQTFDTDPESFYSFAKIRNINTTGITSEVLAYQKMNHGIWIDIFPLDLWDIEDKETYYQIRKLNKSNGTYMRMKNPNLNEQDKERILNWKKTNPYETSKIIQNLAKKYVDCDKKYCMVATVTEFEYDRKIFLKEDYSDVCNMEFEGKLFPAPIGWDTISKTLYGDYMIFPPESERGTTHGTSIFEPDIPYEEYVADRYWTELKI